MSCTQSGCLFRCRPDCAKAFEVLRRIGRETTAPDWFGADPELQAIPARQRASIIANLHQQGFITKGATVRIGRTCASGSTGTTYRTSWRVKA